VILPFNKPELARTIPETEWRAYKQLARDIVEAEAIIAELKEEWRNRSALIADRLLAGDYIEVVRNVG
jgi:hypothetical protein